MWDWDDFRDWEDEGEGHRELVQCNRCGEDDLVWRQTENGWKLFDCDGNQHYCDTSASADDFDNEDDEL